ncbi:serine/threonine-protein kinase TNNI3K, partial [Clonorchis sinensis]
RFLLFRKFPSTMSEVEQQGGETQKPNDPYLPWGFPEEFDLCDAVRVTDLKKITQCIGDGAQIDFLDGFGRTPLHYACQCEFTRSEIVTIMANVDGSYEATKMLLGNKAKVNIMDANRTTPLHLAAGGNHSAITKLLLLNGADIKVECLSGCRAVDFAPYGSETWQVLVDAETGKLPDVDDLTKTKLIPLVPKFAIQREIERQRALEEAKQQKKGKNKQGGGKNPSKKKKKK